MKQFSLRNINSNQSTPMIALLLVLFWSANSFAHAEVGVIGGLVSGLLHPIFGFDHLLAMVPKFDLKVYQYSD